MDTRDFRPDRLRLRNGPPGAQKELPGPTIVRDQGPEVPCCVSASIVGAMEVLDALRRDVVTLSMLYHYYRARPRASRLSALAFRAGLKAALRGVCTADLHPDRINGTEGPIARQDALRKPDSDADADARGRRIAESDLYYDPAFVRLDDSARVDQWRSCIHNNYPVLVGFDLSDSYQRMRNGESDRLERGQIVGAQHGHAVILTGYNDGEKAFRVKDCQGPTFGDSGYWWMPYELAETQMVVESWVIGEITYDA